MLQFHSERGVETFIPFSRALAHGLAVIVLVDRPAPTSTSTTTPPEIVVPDPSRVESPECRCFKKFVTC